MQTIDLDFTVAQVGDDPPYYRAIALVERTECRGGGSTPEEAYNALLDVLHTCFGTAGLALHLQGGWPHSA